MAAKGLGHRWELHLWDLNSDSAGYSRSLLLTRDLLLTWDQTAGASLQKGQPENFSPELMTKHADTHTSLQGEPLQGRSTWCKVQQNTSHRTAAMGFAQAGEEPEEPHQLCHASSCLTAAS